MDFGKPQDDSSDLLAVQEFPPEIRVWVVMGGARGRKRSLLRALTGQHKESGFEVLYDDGNILPFYGLTTPLNELDGPPAPTDVIDYLSHTAVEFALTPLTREVVASVVRRINLLVALRLERDIPGREAHDYLNAMALAGWRIESIVTLGRGTPEWASRYGAPFTSIHDVEQPTNGIAAIVRKLWHWV